MKQIKTIIAAICRTLLGVVFVFSGVVKAIDPLGTVYKIEDYLKAFGGFFIDLLPLAEVVAWGLILLEVLLGVCMLLNVRTQLTSWMSLLFYCVMTPLTLYIAVTTGTVVFYNNFGCFVCVAFGYFYDFMRIFGRVFNNIAERACQCHWAGIKLNWRIWKISDYAFVGRGVARNACQHWW